MMPKRGASGGCTIYALSEVLAQPDAHSSGREVVVPHMAWAERVTPLAAREKDGKSTYVGAAAAAVSAGS